MKTALRPATARARALLKKLQALAQRGIDGERIIAQNKLARLRARFDFSGPPPEETPDLFSGSFRRSPAARWIYSFGSHEFHLANAVKWAIESAANIPCLYREGDLWAEATSRTAQKLTGIADHITRSFRTLLDTLGAVDGLNAEDRGVFILGLYDGMMNEVRAVGQRLPGRSRVTKPRRAKKPQGKPGGGLHIHPYTVALSLGKQIRFSVPLEDLTAELEAVTRKQAKPSCQCRQVTAW